MKHVGTRESGRHNVDATELRSEQSASLQCNERHRNIIHQSWRRSGDAYINVSNETEPSLFLATSSNLNCVILRPT